MTKEPRVFHLIGIGGSGMTPLAEIAHEFGHKVSGSDSFINANCRKLEESGVSISHGHRSSNLHHDVNTIVRSTAISDDNPELLEAQKRNLEVWHRSDLLKFLAEGKKLIGISGTHGKTSTTALVAHMLQECGYEPTAVVGGELLGRNSHSYIGKGDYFVAEMDESDGTFLKFNPFIGVVNNIDLDHLDFYGDLQAIKAAFKTFLSQTDMEGTTIVNWDNIHCNEIGHELNSNNRLTFGTRIGCDIRGLNFEVKASTSDYSAMVERDAINGEVPLIGSHNFSNTLCALSVARALEIPLEDAANAISSYKGVKRRLNCLLSSPKLTIYDDYAHNPGKVSACIEAVKKAHPAAHLGVIFQPHRFSRMKTMYNEFIHSFAEADSLALLPVFSAGEENTGDYSSTSFAEDVEEQCKLKATVFSSFPTRDELWRVYSSFSELVLLSIGAGDVYRISYDLREYFHGLETQEQKS